VIDLEPPETVWILLSKEANLSVSVLVTYATRYGSTQEVAEAVADTLRLHGLVVDVAHMTDVLSLEGYDAVVLGAAIYMFRLHKDARHFLARHGHALTGAPRRGVCAGAIS
jgi:menaquinone-dependent protoporphyrinogen IX oxidase